MLLAALDDRAAGAGRDDVGRARGHRVVDLLRGEHRARTDEDVAPRGDGADRVGRGRGPERDLGDGEPAVDEGLRQRVGVGGVVDHDDGDQAVRRQALQDVAHLCSFAPCSDPLDCGKAFAVFGGAYA